MVTRRIALLSFPFGLPWLQLLSGDFPGQDLQGLLNVRKSKKQKEKRKKKYGGKDSPDPPSFPAYCPPIFHLQLSGRMRSRLKVDSGQRRSFPSARILARGAMTNHSQPYPTMAIHEAIELLMS